MVEIKRRNKTMSNLKAESLNKCVSLLREFIDESGDGSKKGIAALALNQLERITAGNDCNDKHPNFPPTGGGVGSARAYGYRCLDTPRGDESPGDPNGPEG
jgi:hypothetical protein